MIMKPLKFVKIKCQCGHVNLIPVYEVFRVYEPAKCEKCTKVIVEPKEFSSRLSNADRNQHKILR